MHEMAKSIDGLLKLVKDIPPQPVTVAKLKDVEQKWTEPLAAGRLVFEP
jgi:hypothetical protein